MVSVLAKHFVQPVKPSSCLGKTVGCGGRVFLLFTLIYRKPFHRTGVFLESDQSSPRIILRLLDTYLAVIRQMSGCQPLVWQSPRETDSSLLYAIYVTLLFIKMNPVWLLILYYERGIFSALYICSAGSLHWSKWKSLETHDLGNAYSISEFLLFQLPINFWPLTEVSHLLKNRNLFRVSCEYFPILCFLSSSFPLKI